MQIPGHIDPVPLPSKVTPRADGKADIIGLSQLEIRDLLSAAGLDEKQTKLRSKQLFHWIYHRGITDFALMTDMSKTLRPWLDARFVIGRPEIVEAHLSDDGTRKWLLRSADSHDDEMVFFPEDDRGTL
jgi:23S rRNA (adenine2503-C2)-methyltransferase